MKLVKIKQEELNTETQATIKTVAELTGQEVTFINKVVRKANVEPVAELSTGNPGRPPKVFNKAELIAAVEDQIKEQEAADAAKALQTNAEVVDEDITEVA